MYRKDKLVEGEIYHIFSKSIAEFKIFSSYVNSTRMLATIRYYQMKKSTKKFSVFIRNERLKEEQDYFYNFLQGKEKLVEIIAYCLMPTHLHLILKQLKRNGISIFMNDILNSYTRYFNVKTRRKGPLWESRFKSVLVDTDEQLIHLTRYIHLNPVTAYLINKPQEWKFSSYGEYLGKVGKEDIVCSYEDLLSIQPDSYKEFVDDRISYQRSLATIKYLMLD